MKRKVIIFSLALTALLLNGCGLKDTPDSVSPSTVTETPQPSTPAESNATQNVQNTGNGTTIISEEEAKQIALAHAGLTAEEAQKIALDQVTGATAQDIREFKSDYDNGKLKYEGKLYYEQTKYEFEIDGYTGAILEWDVEPIHE